MAAIVTVLQFAVFRRKLKPFSIALSINGTLTHVLPSSYDMGQGVNRHLISMHGGYGDDYINSELASFTFGFHFLSVTYKKRVLYNVLCEKSTAA